MCVAAFFIIQAISGGKITLTPGKLIFEKSVTSAEQSFINSVLDGYTLPNDITVSAREDYSYTPSWQMHMTKCLDSCNDPKADPDKSIDVIYNISVPVSEFYTSTFNIASSNLPNTTSTFTTPDGYTVKYTDLKDLTYENRLLSLDSHYYFDGYNSGALFRILNFTGDNVKEAAEKVSAQAPKYPDQNQVLSLTQTGVTALSRGMVTKLNQTGSPTYFSEKIATFLKASDLTHISNEVSFADGCPGGNNTTTLCSDWRLLGTIQDIGTDIVELTGNHNNDYGADANLATIAKYEEIGLKTFGGGKDETSAAVPLEINQKDNHITLLGYNQSTSTKANGQGASGSQPGANIYSEEKAKADIVAAKERGDFIIVDIQYFECYSYPDEGQEMPSCDAPITGQAEFFHQFIDWGADMVVGTQAHQPQTFELYNNKPIYYGLGNLFFDQIYWPGTTRSIILTHYFDNNKLLQTRLTPTVYDINLQVQPMDEETATWFMNRLNAAR